MMKLGLVQAESIRDAALNLKCVKDYAKEGAAKGCEVICFPECFLSSYAPEGAQELALSREDALLKEVSSIAATCAIDLLLGFMERERGAFFITHGLFRRDGTVEYYRKTHLGEKEKNVFRAGEELKVLTLTNGTKIGISICVETHYPEITQTLSLKGAQIVFAPHAVPRISGDREKIWNKYIPARSYDARVYMACCNLWDSARFGGGCLVTDPRGEVTAAGYKDEAALLVCEVDLDLTASFKDGSTKRSKHYYPALRRKELYE